MSMLYDPILYSNELKNTCYVLSSNIEDEPTGSLHLSNEDRIFRRLPLSRINFFNAPLFL